MISIEVDPSKFNRHDHDVLDVCQEIHGDVFGSSDGISLDRFEALLDMFMLSRYMDEQLEET